MVESYLDWSDKDKHGVLRYLLGTFLVIFAFIALAGFGLIPVTLLYPDYAKSIFGSNLGLLSGFIAPFVLIPLITHWVHKRPSWSVAMPKLQFERENLFMGFFVSTLIGIVLTAILSAVGIVKISYVGINLTQYLPVLFLGLIGVFIQAGAEELLFRGYLAQFTRRISKSPFIFILVPAVLFSLPHIGNISSFGGTLWAVLPYLISGVLYGWAAYKSGSLWMSLGLHWSNNLSGMVLVGIKEDELKSVAPFLMDLPSLNVVTAIIFIQSLLTVLALLYFLKKRHYLFY